MPLIPQIDRKYPALPFTSWPHLAVWMCLFFWESGNLPEEGGLLPGAANLGKVFPLLVTVAVGFLATSGLVNWASRFAIKIRLNGATSWRAGLLAIIPLTLWAMWVCQQLGFGGIAFILTESKLPNAGILMQMLQVQVQAGWMAFPAILFAEGFRQIYYKEKLEEWRLLCLTRQDNADISQWEE